VNVGQVSPFAICQLRATLTDRCMKPVRARATWLISQPDPCGYCEAAIAATMISRSVI